jgi:hypothetical protein
MMHPWMIFDEEDAISVEEDDDFDDRDEAWS